MAAKLASLHEYLKDVSGQVRRASPCDHACHVKSGQKSRRDHLQHLIHSHSNEGPSVMLYFSVFLPEEAVTFN